METSIYETEGCAGGRSFFTELFGQHQQLLPQHPRFRELSYADVKSKYFSNPEDDYGKEGERKNNFGNDATNEQKKTTDKKGRCRDEETETDEENEFDPYSRVSLLKQTTLMDPSDIFQAKVRHLEKQMNEQLDVHRALNECFEQTEKIHWQAREVGGGGYCPMHYPFSNGIAPSSSTCVRIPPPQSSISDPKSLVQGMKSTRDGSTTMVPAQKAAHEGAITDGSKKNSNCMVVVRPEAQPVPYFLPRPRARPPTNILLTPTPKTQHSSVSPSEQQVNVSATRSIATDISGGPLFHDEASPLQRKVSVKHLTQRRPSSMMSSSVMEEEDNVVIQQDDEGSTPANSLSGGSELLVSHSGESSRRYSSTMHSSYDDNTSSSLDSSSDDEGRRRKKKTFGQLVHQFQDICRISAMNLMSQMERQERHNNELKASHKGKGKKGWKEEEEEGGFATTQAEEIEKEKPYKLAMEQLRHIAEAVSTKFHEPKDQSSKKLRRYIAKLQKEVLQLDIVRRRQRKQQLLLSKAKILTKAKHRLLASGGGRKKQVSLAALYRQLRTSGGGEIEEDDFVMMKDGSVRRRMGYHDDDNDSIEEDILLSASVRRGEKKGMMNRSYEGEVISEDEEMPSYIVDPLSMSTRRRGLGQSILEDIDDDDDDDDDGFDVDSSPSSSEAIQEILDELGELHMSMGRAEEDDDDDNESIISDEANTLEITLESTVHRRRTIGKTGKITTQPQLPRKSYEEENGSMRVQATTNNPDDDTEEVEISEDLSDHEAITAHSFIQKKRVEETQRILNDKEYHEYAVLEGGKGKKCARGGGKEKDRRGEKMEDGKHRSHKKQQPAAGYLSSSSLSEEGTVTEDSLTKHQHQQQGHSSSDRQKATTKKRILRRKDQRDDRDDTPPVRSISPAYSYSTSSSSSSFQTDSRLSRASSSHSATATVSTEDSLRREAKHRLRLESERNKKLEEAARASKKEAYYRLEKSKKMRPRRTIATGHHDDDEIQSISTERSLRSEDNSSSQGADYSSIDPFSTVFSTSSGSTDTELAEQQAMYHRCILRDEEKGEEEDGRSEEKINEEKSSQHVLHHRYRQRAAAGDDSEEEDPPSVTEMTNAVTTLFAHDPEAQRRQLLLQERKINKRRKRLLLKMQKGSGIMNFKQFYDPYDTPPSVSGYGSDEILKPGKEDKPQRGGPDEEAPEEIQDEKLSKHNEKFGRGGVSSSMFNATQKSEEKDDDQKKKLPAPMMQVEAPRLMMDGEEAMLPGGEQPLPSAESPIYMKAAITKKKMDAAHPDDQVRVESGDGTSSSVITSSDDAPKRTTPEKKGRKNKNKKASAVTIVPMVIDAQNLFPPMMEAGTQEQDNKRQQYLDYLDVETMEEWKEKRQADIRHILLGEESTSSANASSPSTEDEVDREGVEKEKTKKKRSSSRIPTEGEGGVISLECQHDDDDDVDQNDGGNNNNVLNPPHAKQQQRRTKEDRDLKVVQVAQKQLWAKLDVLIAHFNPLGESRRRKTEKEAREEEDGVESDFTDSCRTSSSSSSATSQEAEDEENTPPPPLPMLKEEDSD